MKSKKLLKSTLAFALSASILSSAILPCAAGAFQNTAKAAEENTTKQELKIATLSDTHYLSPDMIKDTADYTTDLNSDRKMYAQSNAILTKLLDCVKKDSPDILLISGDLTKDGEKQCHQEFAAKLKEVKKELPNLHVYVINGNHDINNSLGKNFNTADDKAVAAEKTSVKDFKEIYADVTYNDSTIVDTYTPPTGSESGSLSYVARPADGFTLIAIDSCRYSADNTDSGKAEHETSGQVSADLEKWVVAQIKAAKDRGDTVLGMEHHGLVEHFSMEKDILAEYLVNDYSKIAAEYADAGMSFIFTGHMHANDIAKVTTDAGNTLYDIETGSVVTFPSPTRAITLSRTVSSDTGNVSEDMDVKTTLHQGPITYTNPLNGKEETIEDITAYGEQHGFSNALFTTTINGALHSYYAGILAQGGSKKMVETMLANLLGDQISGDVTLEKAISIALLAYLPDSEDTSATADSTQVWFDSDKNQINIKAAQSGSDDVLWFKINKKGLTEALTTLLDSTDDILTNDSEMLDEIVTTLIETLTAVPVYEGSDKTILDFLNYIYQNHLGGTDSSANMPAWVQKSMTAAQDGTLFSNLITALIPAVSDSILKITDKINLQKFLGISSLNAATKEFIALDGRTPLLESGNDTTYSMMQILVMVLCNSTADENGYTYSIPKSSTVKDLINALCNVLSAINGSSTPLDLSTVLTGILTDTKDADGKVVKAAILTTSGVSDTASKFIYGVAASMGNDTNIPDDNNTILTNSWTSQALMKLPEPTPTIIPTAAPSNAPVPSPSATPDNKANEVITIEAPKNTVTAPAKATISKIKKISKKKATITTKKIAGAKGYKIQYSTSKKFQSSKTKTVFSTSTSKKITGLKANKEYYVRGRAYKVSGTKKVYGKWSASKKFKTKAA